MDPKSPLNNGQCELVTEINVQAIIDSYNTFYKIDVSAYFQGIQAINLYCCNLSRYQFYFPFNLSGDQFLYKQLSQFDWYYIPWKWEHQNSLQFINDSMSILEIGCGDGSYLKRVRDLFPHNSVKGLELTLRDTQKAFVINETIQQHALLSKQSYDAVCFFQVLEHIADVKTFLESSIEALKPGGILVISVPNNESVFLKNLLDTPLNLPPHHMGLWKKTSLKYLTKLFNIDLVKIDYEVIGEYHYDWFRNTLRKKISRLAIPFALRIANNCWFITNLSRLLRRFYQGPSIMAVYKKRL